MAKKSDVVFIGAGTLDGMRDKQLLWAVVIAAVLCGVLSGMGAAQSAASVAQSKSEQAGAQQGFRITPVRSIAELRAEALKAKPPEEQGPFEPRKLLDLEEISDSIHMEIRYATSDNFLGEPVYEQARAFLQADAANALKRVSRKVQVKGYGLLVYDAYRPWYVTKIFWEVTPVENREFVADPAKGSRHNRGCAVDLTLYDLKTGSAVAMPSGFDEMTPRAHADYAGGTAEEREHRAILREAMESEGFVQGPGEWWHYDYKDWEKYAIVNLPFDKIPFHVGERVKGPKVLERPSASYTKEARKKRIQGTVLLSLVVSESGLPTEIRVTKGLGYGLDEAAVNAASQWKFEPAKIDGKPVPVEVMMEVSFRLYE